MKNYHFSDYEEIKNENNIQMIEQLNKKLLEASNLHSIEVYGDETKNKEDILIFEKKPNGTYLVKNYVGLLSFQGDDGMIHNITIGSRFDQEDSSQQFLSYMLRNANRSTAVVFNEVIVKTGRAPILQQILLFRFIELIKKAGKKGMFKQYILNHYNDSKIKGTIDVDQHIKKNMLGNGKIAYKVTERQVDNPINILILQAFDYLMKKYPQTLKNCIHQLPNVKDYIRQLKAEIPNYAAYEVLKVTSKQVIHPYYSNIEELRKTARDILQDRGVEMFKQSSHKVQGVLLNINKLWEWFLEKTIFNELIIEGVTDTINNGDFEKRILFDDEKSLKNLGKIIPDFTIRKQKVPIAVFDAKHRISWQTSIGRNEKVSGIREDIYQVLAYMNVLNCSVGGVVFPFSRNESYKEPDLEIRSISEYNKKHKFISVPYIIKEKGAPFEKLMNEQNEYIRSRIKDKIESIILVEETTEQNY
ncbi:5-methylcytosine restriction system specificity protein McrC [Exiguobacterium undae]